MGNYECFLVFLVNLTPIAVQQMDGDNIAEVGETKRVRLLRPQTTDQTKKLGAKEQRHVNLRKVGLFYLCYLHHNSVVVTTAGFVYFAKI